MNMKNPSLIKKIFTLVFAISLCFSSFGVPRARAFTPVFDETNFAINLETQYNTAATAITSSANSIVNTTHTSWNSLGWHTMNTLAYQAGQIALNQLTDNTIAWIQGGFHGAPSYEIDTQAMGDELADSITLGLVSQIKGLAVCEFTGTFVDDMTNSLQIAKKKKLPITCPFPDSLTHQTFYASDVETSINNFTWTNFSAALDDAGNPYGVQIAAVDEQNRQQAAAAVNKDKKLSWSNGYADVVNTDDCPSMPSESADYIANGTIIGADVKFSNGNTTSISCTSQSTCDSGSYAAADASGAILSSMTLTYDGAVDTASKQALQKAYCKTTTPGHIVGSQLSKTLGIDTDRLGFADNVDKIISALLTVAVQSAIRAVF